MIIPQYIERIICKLSIPYCLIFADFLSKQFIKILIPLNGKSFLFKSFPRYNQFLHSEKSFPPKNPIVFARTKLSISNEESYLARSKQKKLNKRNSCFFVYEHKLFEFILTITHNSQRITLLNASMVKGKW